MILALKTITILVRICITAMLFLFGYLFYQFKFAAAKEVDLGPLSITQSEASYQLVVDRSSAGYLKKAAKKLNEVIYEEATKHNPDGDLLPDQIDNTIKQEVKEKIKESSNTLQTPK